MPTHKPADIMDAIAAYRKSGPPARRSSAYYRPRPQDSFGFFEDGTWVPRLGTHSLPVPEGSHEINPEVIRLISWNIDIQTACPEERMSGALKHLDEVVSSSLPDVPIVVFLQEMLLSDLQQIRNSGWIKARFNITDVDNTRWLNPFYGTTTLIDRRLKIENVFRVPWISKFERDGLFVDIALSDSKEGNHSLLRLCNVHLETLTDNPPVRPAQVAAAAQYLYDKDVACAFLGGDFNAVQPFDRTLHAVNVLYDAYLELGGEEDDDEGYTWGYQGPPWMMKATPDYCRMDKFLFRGELNVTKFSRIGVGLKVADEMREEVEKEVQDGWITDHYGIMGDFEIGGNWQLVTEQGADGEDARKSFEKELEAVRLEILEEK